MGILIGSDQGSFSLARGVLNYDELDEGSILVTNTRSDPQVDASEVRTDLKNRVLVADPHLPATIVRKHGEGA